MAVCALRFVVLGRRLSFLDFVFIGAVLPPRHHRQRLRNTHPRQEVVSVVNVVHLHSNIVGATNIPVSGYQEPPNRRRLLQMSSSSVASLSERCVSCVHGRSRYRKVEGGPILQCNSPRSSPWEWKSISTVPVIVSRYPYKWVSLIGTNPGRKTSQVRTQGHGLLTKKYGGRAAGMHWDLESKQQKKKLNCIQLAN